MSDAIVVRRRSAGRPSPNLAVLHINAPVGSTITLAKGGVTVKVLDANKGHISAKNSDYADWYYSVSSSNYGEWTVTAANGTNMASASATIDTNKQYDVELTYDLYLIRDGIAITPFLLFHTTQSDTADGIKFQCITDANDYTCVKLTSELLRGIKYTHLIVDFSGTDGANYDHTWFGIASALSTNTSNFVASVAVIQSRIPYIVELNVSAISLTDKYFKLTNSYSGNFSIVRNIYFARR